MSPLEPYSRPQAAGGRYRLVLDHGLGSLAYFYSGAAGSLNADAIGSVILGNSLLSTSGIPVAGEMEIKNVQAMKIMDAFGAGGSFAEFYAVDYKDDVVLMGTTGPAMAASPKAEPKCARWAFITARPAAGFPWK
jgi:L-arabinose isomerase